MSKINPDDPTFGYTETRHWSKKKKTKEQKEEARKRWEEKHKKYRKWMTDMFKRNQKKHGV